MTAFDIPDSRNKGRWPDDAVDEMVRLYLDDGCGPTEIARRLCHRFGFGEVSRNMVVGKLHRLGYTREAMARRREERACAERAEAERGAAQQAQEKARAEARRFNGGKPFHYCRHADCTKGRQRPGQYCADHNRQFVIANLPRHRGDHAELPSGAGASTIAMT